MDTMHAGELFSRALLVLGAVMGRSTPFYTCLSSSSLLTTDYCLGSYFQFSMLSGIILVISSMLLISMMEAASEHMHVTKLAERLAMGAALGKSYNLYLLA